MSNDWFCAKCGNKLDQFSVLAIKPDVIGHIGGEAGVSRKQTEQKTILVKCPLMSNVSPSDNPCHNIPIIFKLCNSCEQGIIEAVPADGEIENLVTNAIESFWREVKKRDLYL
jgi:hypothetical protein